MTGFAAFLLAQKDTENISGARLTATDRSPRWVDPGYDRQGSRDRN